MLLLSVGFSSAIEVTTLNFSWAGVPIEHISQNSPLATNIDFEFSPSEDVESIIIDASDINNDVRKLEEYSSISLLPSSCNETQVGVLSCSAENLVMRTNKNNVRINFTFNMLDGSKEYASVLKSFTFDNTRPSVIKFGPETCVDGKCYVGASSVSLIKIQMEDTLATFVRKKIAFRLGDETAYVYDCVEKTCSGYASPSCSDGVSVPLAIVQYNGLPSQDDAGNSLTGLISTQVICDANPPEIVNKSIKSSSGLSIITSSDEAVVEVIAKDSVSPKLNMTIIGDGVGAQNVTVQCVKQDANFVCKGNIKPQTTVFGTKNIPVILTDVVGNVFRESISFDYYEADETGVIPILWRMGSVNQSVNKFVKRNMAYQRTMYAEVSLTPSSNNIGLVKVESRNANCVPVNPGVSGSTTDVTEVKILYFNQTSNKIYTKITYREGGQITTGRYANISLLEHNCALSINSRKGTTFYSTPQEINFTIKVDLSDGGTLDSYLQKEIDASKKRAEENKKYYEWYDKNLGMVVSVCQAMGLIEPSYAATASIEATTAVIPGAQGVSRTAGIVSDKLGEVKKPTKAFIEMCNYATCKGEYQQLIVGQLNKIPYADDVAQYAGYQSFSDSLNPWNSEYIAYATGCLPAWIHHQKIKNGIECSYLNCLSNGVPNYGTSVSYCQSEKAFSECVYNWGAAFNAMPGLSLLKDVSNRIADIISDPYTLFGTALPFACMALETGTVVHSSCNLVVTITSIPNIIASYSNIFQKPGDPAAQCGIVLDNLGTVRQNALIGNYPEDFSPSGQEFTLENGNTVKCVSGRCDVYNKDKFTGVSLVPIYDEDEADKSPTKGKQILQDFAIYDNGKHVGLKSTLQTYGTTIGPGIVKRMKAVRDEETKKQLEINQLNIKINKLNIELNNLDKNSEDYTNKLNELAKLQAEKQSTQESGGLVIFKLGEGENNVGFGGSVYGDLTDEEVNKISEKTGLTKAEIQAYITENNFLKELGFINEKGEIYFDNKEGVIPKIKSVEEKIVEANNKERKALQQRCPSCLAELDKVQKARTEYYEALKEKSKDIQKKDKEIDEAIKVKKGENELEKLKEEKEKLEKDLEESRENIESAYDDMEEAITFNDYFGSLKSTIRTAWGVGSGLSTLQKLFDSQWGSEWWRSDSIFGQAAEGLRSFGELERTICESDLVSDVSSSEGVILNAEPTSGFSTGAFITARKSAVQFVPNGDSFREYWIDGGVRAKKDGLSYRVIMVDNVGGEVDITFNVTGNYQQVVFAGSSSSFGGMGRSATFKSSTDFSRVCIVFSSSSLGDYFDVVTLSGNKLCQRVVGE